MKKIIKNIINPSIFFSVIWSIIASANFYIFFIQSGDWRKRDYIAIFILALVFYAFLHYIIQKWIAPIWDKIGFKAILVDCLSCLLISVIIFIYLKPYDFSIIKTNPLRFNELISGIDLFFVTLVFTTWLKNRSSTPDNAKNSSLLIENRFTKLISRVTPLWTNILFVIICIIIGSLEIGNFHGRIGSIHGDDGPIVYSVFFAHQDRFSNDIIATYGQQQVYATIQNFIPAVLYRYLSVSPELMTLLLTYLQYILLGLSVKRFARKVSGKEVIGWLAGLFIFAANPWDWNLANYGNVMYIPYAGHLVMPFILFSLSDILEEKNKRAMIWLLISGLIHPTLTLYSIGMISIYWLINRRFKSNLVSWILLITVAITAVIPRLVMQSTFSQDLLSFSEMKPALLGNAHMSPMAMTMGSQSFLLFLPIVFLALKERKKLLLQYSSLLLSITIGVVLLVVASWLGWKFEILEVIQFIPQRSTTILVFASLPLVMTYFFYKLNNDLLITKIITMLFIVAFVWSNSLYSALLSKPEFGILLLVLIIPDLISGRFGLFTWNVKQSRSAEQVVDNYQKENTEIRILQTGWLVLVLICIIGIAFKNAWFVGAVAREDKSLSSYQIQTWTRENTPENAMVINMSRAISQRAEVTLIPYNWYVYNRSRECKEYIDRYYKFYSPLFSAQQADSFYTVKLTSEDIIQFAHTFQANYILRSVDEPLELENVYQNADYILYKIPVN